MPLVLFCCASDLLLVCRWSLCQFVNFMHIEYLEEYEPSAAEKADPMLYASNVRKLMASKLGVEYVTDHDFSDLRKHR
jgi:lysophosphatidylcholine acyltransferase/lyso-PAF acetyltransferase